MHILVGKNKIQLNMCIKWYLENDSYTLHTIDINIITDPKDMFNYYLKKYIYCLSTYIKHGCYGQSHTDHHIDDPIQMS